MPVLTLLIAMTNYLTKASRGKRIYFGSQCEGRVHHDGDGLVVRGLVMKASLQFTFSLGKLACVCVCVTCVDTQEGQKRVPDAWELELQWLEAS